MHLLYAFCYWNSRRLFHLGEHDASAENGYEAEPLSQRIFIPQAMHRIYHWASTIVQPDHGGSAHPREFR